MIDLENLDFSKIDINELVEEFKNFGKMLVSAEDIVSKARAGESLAGAKVVGLDLSGADLRGVNLEQATFLKTNFQGANLTDAKLGAAEFTEVDLGKAQLAKADLSHARMVNTSCDGAVFRGANLSGLTVGVEQMLLKDPSEIIVSPKLLELAKQDLSTIDFASLNVGHFPLVFQ